MMISYYNQNYSFSKINQHGFGLYANVGCKNPADEQELNYEEIYGEEWYEEDEEYDGLTSDKYFKKG